MKKFNSTYINLLEKYKRKKKKRKEEDSETQLNDVYTDVDISNKPPPFKRRRTYLFPPNYGMGEGQTLTPKPNTL